MFSKFEQKLFEQAFKEKPVVGSSVKKFKTKEDLKREKEFAEMPETMKQAIKDHESR